jgi:hypothetical protein
MNSLRAIKTRQQLVLGGTLDLGAAHRLATSGSGRHDVWRRRSSPRSARRRAIADNRPASPFAGGCGSPGMAH